MQAGIGSAGAGSGGSGGKPVPTAGTGAATAARPNGIATAHLSDSCSQAGLVACDGHNSQDRFRCDGSKWLAAERCQDNQRCSTSVDYLPGTCLMITQACTGKAPGAKSCDRATGSVVTCGLDLLSTNDAMACSGATPVCENGACTCRHQCGGVCLDLTSDARNCGVCGHSCADRSCNRGLCDPAKLTEGNVAVWGFAADAKGALWFDTDNKKLMSVGPDGGTVRTLATDALATPWVALDATSVYANAPTLSKVPRQGGTSLALTDLVVDKAVVNSSAVFFVAAGVLSKVSKSGGTISTLVSPINIVDMVADETFVYWTDNKAATVMKVPVTGGAAIAIAQGQAEPTGIAVNSSYVYWSTTQGITRAGLDGSLGQLFIERVSSYHLAASATHLYWETPGQIQRIPHAGGDWEQMTQHFDVLINFAVDGSFLFWLEGMNRYFAVKKIAI